jgi:hypothetical protein
MAWFPWVKKGVSEAPVGTLGCLGVPVDFSRTLEAAHHSIGLFHTVGHEMTF